MHHNYAINNISHHACSRAKDHRTYLPGPLIEKNTVFSECVHAYSPDYMIFMFNAGCLVQY